MFFVFFIFRSTVNAIEEDLSEEDLADVDQENVFLSFTKS